jgi:hypothetical protein
MNKKSGKGKGKHFGDLNSNRKTEEGKEEIEFPKALRKGTHVIAMMRGGKEWKIAVIKDVRKGKRKEDDQIEESKSKHFDDNTK